jgi:hypothetical protein
MTKIPSVPIIRSRREPVLVCKKCLKRFPKAGKIKRALKAMVKRRSAAQPMRRPRVVLTGCFGICPKDAVVLANGTTLHRGEYVLLADSSQVDEVASLLMQRDRP